MEIIIWKWLLHARQCDIELSVHGRVMKRNEAVRASYSKITQRTIENESFIEMEMIRTAWDSYKRRRGLFYSYCFSSSTKVDPGKQSANLHRSSRQLAVNKSVIALVPPLLHTTNGCGRNCYRRLRSEPTFNFDHYNNTSWPKFSLWWAWKSGGGGGKRSLHTTCVTAGTRFKELWGFDGLHHHTLKRMTSKTEKWKPDDHSQRWWALRRTMHKKIKRHDLWTPRLCRRAITCRRNWWVALKNLTEMKNHQGWTTYQQGEKIVWLYTKYLPYLLY